MSQSNEQQHGLPYLPLFDKLILVPREPYQTLDTETKLTLSPEGVVVH